MESGQVYITKKAIPEEIAFFDVFRIFVVAFIAFYEGKRSINPIKKDTE